MSGKIPPHAVDLEKTILGACIIESNAISEAVEIFRDEPVFYKPEHQAIYDTLLAMFKASENIDTLTLISNLKKTKKLEEVGGEFYIIDLSGSVSSTAHLEYHCRIVQQQYVKRQSIHVASELLQKSFEDDSDIFDILDESYRELDRVTEWLQTKKPTTLPELVSQLFKRAESKEPGVPSSINKINDLLNGYQNSDLIINAARPGMGKTAFMLSEALHQARNGYPVGIFSLEMAALQLIGRQMANFCSIDGSRIHSNRLSTEERQRLEYLAEEFKRLPIFIHDQPSISILELKIQAKKWKRDHNIRMIYIDYLQLMTVSSKKGTNREQEISEISRSLKALAKELDIPIMALSQLSRAVETRGGEKRPMLSDLRESGAIEQDADIVQFIYRPQYYDIENWSDDGTPTDNQAEIDHAKNRHGKTGYCRVGCNLRYMQFHNLEESHTIPESVLQDWDMDDKEPF